MIKISVITICYNAAKTIEETILSVINQDYDNLEYIIIDGESTDGTINIVNKYRDRIAYFVSEPDNGISDAFNKGIKTATGDLIGIINSDDYLYKDALKKVGEYFNDHPNCDLVHGNTLRFDDGDLMGRLKYGSTDYSRLKLTFEIYHPSTFIKKSAYEKYGYYDINYKIAMDYELISKMYYSGANFGYINDTLTCFRYGGISTTALKSTLADHKRVALRNGASKIKINWFIIKHFYIRNSLVFLLKKAHLFIAIREIIKPCKKYKLKWWEE